MRFQSTTEFSRTRLLHACGLSYRRLLDLELSESVQPSRETHAKNESVLFLHSFSINAFSIFLVFWELIEKREKKSILARPCFLCLYLPSQGTGTESTVERSFFLDLVWKLLETRRQRTQTRNTQETNKKKKERMLKREVFLV